MNFPKGISSGLARDNIPSDREGGFFALQPAHGGGKYPKAPRTKQTDTFRLPTLRGQLLPILLEELAWTVDWLISICMSLNSFWGRQKLLCQERHRADGVAGGFQDAGPNPPGFGVTSFALGP